MPKLKLSVLLIFFTAQLLASGDTTEISLDTIHVRICPGQVDCVTITAPDSFVTYEWSTGGTGQSEELCMAGNYSYTVTDSGGGTGAGVIVVEDGPPSHVAFQFSFCSGDEFVEGTPLPPVVGMYTDTIYDPLSGCPDSIISTTIVERPLNFAFVDLYTCPGDDPPYVLIDTIFSIDSAACDTVYTVTISTGQFYPLSRDTVICGDGEFPFVFQGVEFLNEGIVLDTFYAENGVDCDTIRELEVVVHPIVHPPTVTSDQGTGTGEIVFQDTTLTYLWPDGMTGRSQTALARGHYHVTISNSNGCSKVYHVYIPGPLEDDPFSSNEIPEIYPNPTNDDITIDLPSDALTTEHEVIITDVHGRLAYRETVLGSSSIQVELPQQAGVYQVSIVRSGMYIAVERIIRTQ